MVRNRLLISVSNGTTTGWKGCRESSEVCQEYKTILAQSVEKIERSVWHEAFCEISCNNWTSEPTNFRACRQRLYCYNRRYTKCFEAEKHQETIRRRLKEAGTKVSLVIIITIVIITTSHRLITRLGRLRLLLGPTCSQFLPSISTDGGICTPFRPTYWLMMYSVRYEWVIRDDWAVSDLSQSQSMDADTEVWTQYLVDTCRTTKPLHHGDPSLVYQH